MKQRPRVLVIAGSDSSGGAGLLRDAQTLSEFNVDMLCAITAVTAQTDDRVDATCYVPPDLVAQQVSNALKSGQISAIKIGMLGTRAIVDAVVRALPPRELIPIVLDPVLASSSGVPLLDSDGIAALRNRLLARSTLVTPNLIEAAALLGETVATTEARMVEQAERILSMGPTAVLLKGGHATCKESVDVLLIRGAPTLRLSAERVDVHLRGTGCALSSAIAAGLARGFVLAPACECGKQYVLGKLRERTLSDSGDRPLQPTATA
jgi:hydroxymethylpyrimidine/phosphomethylpyrimidine kinase